MTSNLMNKIQEIGDLTTIEFTGKTLNLQSGRDFRQEFEPQIKEHKQIVLDLSAVTFIDSSGLGVLISCLKKAREAGGDIKLCGLTSQVRALFQLVRMHKLFDIYNSREEAAHAFKS